MSCKVETYYTHSTDKENEAKPGQVICPSWCSHMTLNMIPSQFLSMLC